MLKTKRVRVPESVQIVVMRESFGKYETLLLKRIHLRGGFWQPITGRVEPGESFLAAAQREIQEEIGISFQDGNLIDLNYTHSYPLKSEWLENYPPGTTHNDEAAFAFWVSKDKQICIDPHEHDEFCWNSFEEALKKIIWHGNREALKRAFTPKNTSRRNFEWCLSNRKISLGNRTKIMGVLNITPDSFSDGGKWNKLDAALEKAFELETQGADILDIGAESTRPGAEIISVEEELSRILPLLKKLEGKLRIPISIDTYKSQVAEVALDNGAEIINDISGLRFDKNLASVVSKARAGLVIMHSRGTCENLHELPPVLDIEKEVKEGFLRGINLANEIGIENSQIVIDPGIGFGKTLQDNLILLKNLSFLSKLGFPLLVGTSRKSFIGKIIDQPHPSERIYGTAATVVISILNGAHIVRVHDVTEMIKCAKVADVILSV